MIRDCQGGKGPGVMWANFSLLCVGELKSREAMSLFMVPQSVIIGMLLEPMAPDLKASAASCPLGRLGWRRGTSAVDDTGDESLGTPLDTLAFVPDRPFF